MNPQSSLPTTYFVCWSADKERRGIIIIVIPFKMIAAVRMTCVLPPAVRMISSSFRGCEGVKICLNACCCNGRRSGTDQTCVDAATIASSKVRHGGKGDINTASRTRSEAIEAVRGVVGSSGDELVKGIVLERRTGVENGDAMVDRDGDKSAEM